MKSFSFAYGLSSIILVTNVALAAEAPAPGHTQSGSERSIIIVSGKNSKSGLAGSPGSKVTLNPQPLPPRANANTSIRASKVMLNPQPLPPRTK
jgi:hypothetical protein